MPEFIIDHSLCVGGKLDHTSRNAKACLCMAGDMS